MDITNKLLQWYDKNKRDLPWRNTKDPYAIWVSEIMLQQTRVDTAIGYYNRFLQHFKDVETLARSDEQDILNVWKGLGYYSRARNMHRTAKAVCEGYNGVFPRDRSELQKLPGIGRYTAAAIVSIAYGIAAPAVDGNVLRVISRIYGLWEDIAKDSAKRAVEDIVQKLIPEERAGDFTQALMELGAAVCVPQTPDCTSCPASKDCIANNDGFTDKIPVKAPKEKPNPVIDYWVLILRYKDRLLMEFRGKHTLLKNLWGFPMIEYKDNAYTKDYLQNEYGVLDYEEKEAVTHVFTHKTWRMHILRAELAQEVSKAGLEWIRMDEIDQLPVPTAFKKVLAALYY